MRVLHESGGKRTVVSHFNKATKGRIVRALLEDGADPRTPKALAETVTVYVVPFERPVTAAWVSSGPTATVRVSWPSLMTTV